MEDGASCRVCDGEGEGCGVRFVPDQEGDCVGSHLEDVEDLVIVFF